MTFREFRKHPLEEVHSLESVDHPVDNASVHVAIDELSPVKKGKQSIYFNGCVTDCESRMRNVGFSAEQQQKLASLKEK